MAETTIPRRLGKYTIEGLIDRGSMGMIFEARQEIVDRTVAIKVLHPSVVKMFPHGLTRFTNEAKSVARLLHPNIVPIYDIGTDAGFHYFVMEYFRARSLRDVLRERAPSVREVCSIFAQAACALDHAGGMGIVHRDIKLTNILLDPRGLVKVLDFGISKAKDSDDLTRTGFVVGCANYMSPEQARGEKVDIRSDIFSLGVVAYVLLTGRRPFEAASKRDLILERGRMAGLPRERLPRPCIELVSAVPRRLDAIVRRCMAPLARDRYPRAGAILDDLRAVPVW